VRDADLGLEAMLRARGDTGAATALDEVARKLADVTGKSDVTFKVTERLAESFGLTGAQIIRILPGIEGQAETMHQSIDQVTESFGRAFARGNIGAMRRTGIVLSEADIQAINVAKSVSFAAGQQEIYNRVLASFQHYAIGAG